MKLYFNRNGVMLYLTNVRERLYQVRVVMNGKDRTDLYAVIVLMLQETDRYSATTVFEMLPELNPFSQVFESLGYYKKNALRQEAGSWIRNPANLHEGGYSMAPKTQRP